MKQLGNGLSNAKQYEDALSVKEAQLSLKRRLGVSEDSILVAQSNLATSYHQLGRLEETNRMLGDVYSGYCRLLGEDGETSLALAYNYANSFSELRRFEEAKALLRKTLPVARRVLGESHELTLRMRRIYADALYLDDAVTLDDLREAVTTLEDAGRTARRVLGGAHPMTKAYVLCLRNARVIVRAREDDGRVGRSI